MGSEAKWTPGPWRVRTNPRSGIVEGIDTAHDVQAYFKNGKPRGNPTPIGVVCGLIFVRRDDARLIAAAPEMAEALTAFRAWDENPHATEAEAKFVRCLIAAALALAEEGGK